MVRRRPEPLQAQRPGDANPRNLGGHAGQRTFGASGSRDVVRPSSPFVDALSLEGAPGDSWPSVAFAASPPGVTLQAVITRRSWRVPWVMDAAPPVVRKLLTYESLGPQGVAKRRSGSASAQPVSFDQVNVPAAVYHRIKMFVATLRL